MSKKLRELLDAGRLHQLAVGCKTSAELAAKLGLQSETFSREARRLRAAGVAFPTFDELQRTPGEFSDEEPTLQDALPTLGKIQPAEGMLADEPANDDVPSGHFLKGRSTLRDADGRVVMRWDKTSVTDQHYREALLLALQDPLTWIRGQAEPIERPAYADEDLLTVYGIGDAHLGMHSWGEETGEDFDLKIAQRDLYAAIDGLVAQTPRSKQAIVLSVGDFVHFDNEAKTTTAGTRQDADTRLAKVMRAAIASGRHCTDRALSKHDLVDDIWISGNHDSAMSMAITLALAAFYEREPRVTVETSPNPFIFRRHGKVLLGFCHGHEAKVDRLPSVMACDRAADWGETEFREWITGHVHHLSTKEYPGCVVKTLRTLATSDRWHHGSGYRSGHEMVAMTYHREWGLIDTRTIGIRQVRAMGAIATVAQ